MLGQQPTAGYALHVTRVSQEGGVVRVGLRVARPPPGRVLAAVVTQPYVMIQVDRVPRLDTVMFVGEDRQVLQSISLLKSN
ncbi:MAG: protease complex subunit PrcB family protein [Nitrospirota bacterium]